MGGQECPVEWLALRVWAADLRDLVHALVSVLDALESVRSRPAVYAELWRSAQSLKTKILARAAESPARTNLLPKE